ncbi:DUF3956 family protein [Peribacillus sp. FSL P2-0133]|uniref:DUF3956 family protein n=1 Tax=Peribacillus sp. FSL P2-0133 TaxID=2921573 RepID=UPI0030CF4C7B
MLEVNGQFFLITDIATLRIRISSLLASTLIGLGFPICGEKSFSQHFLGIPIENPFLLLLQLTHR